MKTSVSVMAKNHIRTKVVLQTILETSRTSNKPQTIDNIQKNIDIRNCTYSVN